MFTYTHTRRSCYVGYMIQALVCNLAPLLFVTFQNKFGVSLAELSYLILCNFLFQLAADVFGTRYGDRLGYRRMALLCYGLSFAGFLLMAGLPFLLKNTFAALLISSFVYAFGGGLSEVMLNSVIDGLSRHGAGAPMPLLHSFFSWGQVLTVVLSTVFLKFVGEDVWYLLPAIWAVIPLVNFLITWKVPMPDLVPAEKRTSLTALFKKPAFLLMIVIMLTAGACEMTLSQWASFFAEKGLGVTKVVGDLLGPCAFAVLMGAGRVIHGVFGQKWNFSLLLPGSAVLCIACYLTASLAGAPILALMGCAVCGLSVCLMWPGTLDLAADRYPLGGTAMFGILAIAGDLGCSLGPWLSGLVSDAVQGMPRGAELAANAGITAEQLGLKAGILICALFPLILLICALALNRLKGKRRQLA